MSNAAIPVGSIVAYAGPITDAQKQSLAQTGWLVCDGSPYPSDGEYQQLALAILDAFGGIGGPRGEFRVPDLRGRFLRGTSYDSAVDPDASARIASNFGGNHGNSIGSLQSSATALPKSPFVSASAGEHAHNVPHAPSGNNAYALAGSHYAIWRSGPSPTDAAGAHTHALTGGWDAESRPSNVYVHFLIKSQDG